MRGIAFAFLLGIVTNAYGQRQQPDTLLRYRIPSVAIAPQYLIMQAIRVDVEKPLVWGQHIHRLTFSPYLYAGKDAPQYRQEGVSWGAIPPDDYGKTKVSGFGLEVLDKYGLQLSNQRPSSVYLAVGAGYHRIRLDYLAYVPVPFMEEGTQLFRYEFADQQEQINRLDVIGLIGLKSYARRNILVFDFFAGPVLKNSWISPSAGSPNQHDEITDHGYHGVTYRVGMTIGVLLF